MAEAFSVLAKPVSRLEITSVVELALQHAYSGLIGPGPRFDLPGMGNAAS